MAAVVGVMHSGLRAAQAQMHVPVNADQSEPADTCFSLANKASARVAIAQGALCQCPHERSIDDRRDHAHARHRLYRWGLRKITGLG
jgi:hypothetical protein